jgi:hypothetical protein
LRDHADAEEKRRRDAGATRFERKIGEGRV